MKTSPRLLPALALLFAASGALADEAVIRKALAERLPNLPKIDEVTRSPLPGLWEVRIGTELLYTDAQGQYMVQGEVIDLRSRTNLTQQRIDKLTAFDFDKLPLKDAIAIRQGKGTRKMAVFMDPNCGFCKRFERDVSNLKDVTVYIYLYPILGPDSQTKARDIWCAKDPAQAYRDWMLNNKLPASAPARCDVAAIERNVELGRKHRVNGTPASVFEDDSRLGGAVPGEQVEKQLAQAARKG
jgi:thiol:disulfide interchange protein DsbC